MRLSIIVPCLNEATRIAGALERLQDLRGRGTEIIVVDGGSVDGSAELARPHADQVLTAPRGRASQMNAGAAVANGDVLLFLHADCALPARADRLIIDSLATSGRRWGHFDVRLSGAQLMLPLIAFMMNQRSRVTGVATGDQGIFVTRELFAAVGRYADIPLMEDVAIAKRLRRQGPPLCLRERMTVSARRWQQYGVLGTMVLMWRLRLAYFLGADPAELALRYQGGRRSETTRILVFAKAPAAGAVKTRLIPLLGAQRAAALQRILIEHALDMAVIASLGKVELWCAPSARDPLLATYSRRSDVTLASQGAGDLGERMTRAAAHALKHAARVIIVGSDCPALSSADLRSAADALEKHDAVFAPAEDGGYALIGLRRSHDSLFRDVPWGTDQVMTITRARLAKLGWRWHELPTTWDVDRPADYERLCASGLVPGLDTITSS